MSVLSRKWKLVTLKLYAIGEDYKKCYMHASLRLHLISVSISVCDEF